MENRAEYPKYNFQTARTRMDLLFGTNMNEDDFLEKAYITWLDMPDRHSMSHVYIGTIDSNNVLEIPENVEYIKAVTSPASVYELVSERYDRLMFYYNGSRMYNAISNEFNWDNYRLNGSIDDRFGDSITYELTGSNTLEFKQGNLVGVAVAVLYKGLLVDETCDPLLYNNEVNGIATMVANMDVIFRASAGDPNAIKMLQYMEQKANLAITRSGIPSKATEAQFDMLLNTKASHNRKFYNRRYKFK